MYVQTLPGLLSLETDGETVEVPLNIHSDVATYEAPFGHVQRPTHKNTTWDLAKFEVCGHKVRAPVATLYDELK